MTHKEKEMKFWDEVRYTVTLIEQSFLKGRPLGWETTREFSELYGKYYTDAYRLIRKAADFWNQNLANDYKVMFDCDCHGYIWRFHTTREDLRDLCWIAAIRTDSHNKRALGNFGKATSINTKVKDDVKMGTTEIIIPSSVKDYENNDSED